MQNKGYTIMEAVVAMFLVVVMVGAVFSALMSSRRAIISSSEREEVLYSLQSAYGMLKDCRSNTECHLKKMGCNYEYSVSDQDLKTCNGLFTFNFKNLCEKDSTGVFSYNVKVSQSLPEAWLSLDPGMCVSKPVQLEHFNVLSLKAQCTE